MPVYKAPVEDAMFLLNDVIDIGRYNNLPGFEDVSIDTVSAIKQRLVASSTEFKRLEFVSSGQNIRQLVKFVRKISRKKYPSLRGASPEPARGRGFQARSL